MSAERDAARKTGFFLALLYALGSAFAWFVYERHFIPDETLVRLRCFYVIYALALGVLSLRMKWPSRFSRYFPVFLLAPVFAISWYTHHLLNRSGYHFSPFLGAKFAYFALSLTPGFEVSVNLALMAACTVEVFVLWFFGGVRESMAGTATGEPWVTLFFAVMASQLLIFQRASRRLQFELGEMRTRMRLLEDLAVVALLLRDKLNTPLQTLRTSLRILEKNGSEAPDQKARMRASLDKIAEINSTLRVIEPFVEWKNGDLLDEKAALERLSEDLNQTEVKFRLRLGA